MSNKKTTRIELRGFTLVARTDRIHLSIFDKRGKLKLITEDDDQFFLLMCDEVDRALAGKERSIFIKNRCDIGCIVARTNPFDNMPGFDFNYFELRLWGPVVDIDLTRAQMVKLSGWMTYIYNRIPDRKELK